MMIGNYHYKSSVKRVKELEWKMWRTGGGVDGVKNWSGQWEGPGGGELDGCIMHRVQTSLPYWSI
jgi:hypothetical protein